MATTTNGIYYPNDYSAIADVPEDMKKMANSIEQKVVSINTNISNIQTKNTQQDNSINNLIENVTNIQTKDTTQDTLIEELQKEKAKLQAENERLKEDINGLPTGNATGNTIYLNDTAEMRVNELKVSGNSRQETREGYNLLKLKDVEETTVNGLTYSVKDGVIYLNGTTTEQTRLWLELEKNIVLNGTYTNQIITDFTPTKDINCNYHIALNDWSVSCLNVNPRGSKYKTETVAIENEIKYFFIQIVGDTFSNTEIRPQLVLGSEPKDYEPYGAMPSPDYPSEVESVGDNVNLFDKTNTVDGKYYDNSGNLVNESVSFMSDYIKVIKNSYILSIRDSTSALRICTFDENKTFIRRIISTSKTELAIEIAESEKYVILSSNKLENKDTMKFEKGSVATGYSPYGMGSVSEVVCGKNMIPFPYNSGDTYTNKGITYTTNSDGSVSANGTSTENQSNYMLFQGNWELTTDMIGSVTNNTNCNGMVAYVKNGETDWKYANLNGLKLTIGDVIKRIYLQVYTSGTTVSETVYPMLELGTTATDYEPYQSQTYTIPTQQPMRKVGDIKDEFIKVDSKWYERHNIVEEILDGNTKNISYYSAPGKTEADNMSTAYFSFMNRTKSINTEYSSNMFKDTGGTLDYIWGYANMTTDRPEALVLGTTTDESIRIRINKDKLIGYDNDLTGAEKVALLKTYLAEHPIKIYYARKTPLDLECTPEQTEILTKIENEVKTYKGVTHIYSTDNVSPIIDVRYKKDLETRLAAIENAILNS